MWIPFIPLFAAGVLLRVYQALFDPKGADVGLVSGGSITLGFAAIIILTFVILGVMSFLDKRTSALYEIKKNIPAGICAVAAGAFLFAGAVTSFMQGINIIMIVDVVVSVVGGAAIIVMGISSLSGKNIANGRPVLIAMTAICIFVKTFLTFLGDTSIASESRDMTDLVVMAFATMFLFNCSMVYLHIKGRNAVKGCFLYGMPLLLTSTAYTLAHTIDDLKMGTFSFIENVEMYEFFAIALFALFFLLELSFNAKERSKEEYEEAGIDPAKHMLEPEEEEIEVDPDSVIHLTDDPLMLQAEEAMKSLDDNAADLNDISKFDGNYESDEQNIEPDLADFNEEEDTEAYAPDIHTEEEFLPQEEAEASESDNYDGKAEETSNEAQNDVSPDDELSDIDIDSINRLISELTNEG